MDLSQFSFVKELTAVWSHLDAWDEMPFHINLCYSSKSWQYPIYIFIFPCLENNFSRTKLADLDFLKNTLIGTQNGVYSYAAIRKNIYTFHLTIQ